MKRIANLFKKRSNVQTGEVPWLRSVNPDEILSPEDALKVGAVFACVRVIAETVATLPCILYRRLPGGGKERAVDHPLYSILHDSPNNLQDVVQFFEMMTGHLALRGNAYAYVDFTTSGTQMIPLHPGRVTVKVTEDGLYKYFEYFDGKTSKVLKPQNVLHVFGLSSDGYKGLCPIDLAMRTVNLTKKQEVYADKMFTNQASPGGVLKHPQKISEPAAKRLKEEFDKKYSGAEKAGSTMLLEEGMEWQQIGLTNEQAQFIQGRKFSRSEIAMWFRMPPHKIGDLEKATFSNIEHQSLEFVTDTIRPWLVRWERALLRTLFTAQERKEFVIEFLADAILRGDSQTRSTVYASGRQWGWLNVDEIRERENMNPLPDGQGKTYLTPGNMMNASQESESEPKKSAPKPGVTEDDGDEDESEESKEDERHNWVEVMEPVFRAVLERSLRRRSKAVAAKGWTPEIREREVSFFQTDIAPILAGLKAQSCETRLIEQWEAIQGEAADESQVDAMIKTIEDVL